MKQWLVMGCLTGCLGAAAFAQESTEHLGSVAASLATDLMVEIRHLDGSVEKFGQEIAGMDIVVAPDSTIKYVHLILVTGAEKDTHLWYNYDAIAGFRYQFASITGKGKVKVKQLGLFQAAEKTGLQETIPQIQVSDFK
ncbi:MAG: hypothetical protein H7A43_09410 [Verrucomicrobia bacterium]|nr:hypothetical protein [Kiritimatiellia bacterium]MCP5488853.1 hypothetical protein [Verrucomicrobiota bacterium]